MGALLVGGLIRGTSGPSFEVVRDDTSAVPTTEPVSADPATTEEPRVVVDVGGSVIAPGVYELAGEVVRVRDAVEAAGGLSEGADTSSMNLAAPVSDGSKVYVPAQGEVEATAGGSASVGSSQTSGVVNINTADEAALDTLPGIGLATADAIVRDREANGPFTSVEDLMRVSGIGEKKFEKLQGLISV
jgi:competence protein ComEA